MTTKARGRAMEWLMGMRYTTKLIFRPFKGFYDLKFDRRGNMLSATALLILAILTHVFNRQYCGYYFSTYNANTFNLFSEMAVVALPFFLWVISSWCLTTLMNGEGSLKDIYIATAYSLTPFIVIVIPLTIISRGMCGDEAQYYYFAYGLALAWVGLLIFLGTMITHQYELLKTVLTCVLILLGICIILFIALLFYSLIQEVWAVFVNSYKELSFRAG